MKLISPKEWVLKDHDTAPIGYFVWGYSIRKKKVMRPTTLKNAEATELEINITLVDKNICRIRVKSN